MSALPAWRMLPPAGAPLTLASIAAGITALARQSDPQTALCAALAERFGARHARLADTGRAALALALIALGRMHPDRDEVLLPAYVSFSVPSAVVNAGFKIRLYDVNSDDLTPDYASMAKAVSGRTLAVIVCHQFGLVFDPFPAAALCRECGAALIDDAAQAMGGTVEGKYAGCLGDVGLFSLSRGKPLTAVDGGVLLTDNDDIARAIDEAAIGLPDQGADAMHMLKAVALCVLRRPELYRLPTSLPGMHIGASIFDPSFPRAPLSRFRAGLALAALAFLAPANAARTRVAMRYIDGFSRLPVVRLIPPQAASVPVYLRFPVMPGPGEDFHALPQAPGGRAAKNLGISRGFPLPLDAVPGLGPYLAEQGRVFPGARRLADTLITLPTHDQVKEKDIAAIMRLFSSFARRAQVSAAKGQA